MVYKGIIMWLYAFGDIFCIETEWIKIVELEYNSGNKIKEVVGYISDSNSDVGQEHTWNSTKWRVSYLG